MDGQQVTQFEKPAETVAQLQPQILSLIFLLKTAGDLLNLIRQLGTRQGDENLHHFHDSIERVKEPLPVAGRPEIRGSEALFHLPDGASHHSLLIEHERHQAEQREGAPKGEGGTLDRPAAPRSRLNLCSHSANQVEGFGISGAQLLAESVQVVVKSEARVESGVLKTRHLPRSRLKIGGSLFNYRTVAAFAIQSPGEKAENLCGVISSGEDLGLYLA